MQIFFIEGKTEKDRVKDRAKNVKKSDSLGMQ